MIDLEVIVKVTIVTGVALAACLILRRRSAAARHWTVASALLATLLMPVLGRVAPQWRVPAIQRLAPSVPQADVQIAFAQPRATSPAAAVNSDAPESPTEKKGPRFATALIAVWMVGAAIMFAVLVAGLGRLWWLARQARVVDEGPWHDAVTALAAERGMRRVTLLQSDHPTLLVTWGVWRPNVILPAPARSWPAARIRLVLRHELAHIRRGDWIAQLVAEAAKALHWYDPLVWIAVRRLRTESELACDAELMQEGVPGPEYASELLELARALNAPRTSWTAALAMARPSSLEGRVTAMLTEHLDRQPIEKKTRAFAIAGALVVATALAGLNVFAQSFSTVSGSVTNQMGGVIPGAAVALTSADKERKYEVKADANGQYRFVGVVPGDYTLSNMTPGFKYGNIPLTVSGTTVRRDLSLEVGTLEETISVKPGSGPRTSDLAAAAAAPAPAPIACTPTSGGAIKQPTKLADWRPRYPENLAAAQAGGLVVLDAVIATDGTVKQATGKAGSAYDPDLLAAAIDAVKHWRFTPTLLNCVPIEVEMTVTVRFSPQ